MNNLLIAIEAAGGQPSQVAKLTVLIVDHSEQRAASSDWGFWVRNWRGYSVSS
jgi:enamine deaminase RidA (YjgF/YER057c/UK114 family)